MIVSSATLSIPSVNTVAIPFPGYRPPQDICGSRTGGLAVAHGVCYNRVVGRDGMSEDAKDREVAGYIDRVKKGDKDAFSFIIKTYKMYVLKIVNRHIPYEEAEEVAHDAFVRIYESLPRFKGEGGFRQWMAAITTRACYDYWRRAYRSREVPMSSLGDEHREWLERAASETASIEDIARQAEARELLEYALSRLSAEDRMVLELVYMEGLSVREVAGLLGWSTANVKIRSFRSRRKLHKLLKDAGRR